MNSWPWVAFSPEWQKGKLCNEMEYRLLKNEDAFSFFKLTFNAYQPYLMNCSKESILAAGAFDGDGKPCGLAIAADGGENRWQLLSFLVTEVCRGEGAGRRLLELLMKELRAKHAQTLLFQSVLREEKGNAMCAFAEKTGGSGEMIVEVYHYTPEKIMKVPRVARMMKRPLNSTDRFRYLTFSQLEEETHETLCKALKENEGNWYPPNLSPYIGGESVNSDCTIFAIDSRNEQIVGWITGLNVNDGRNILYRTLYVRPEYRDTRIGFYLFRESVRQNVTKYPEVTGIASIEKDNEPMLRFLESFLQGAYDYKSYEYQIKWVL